MNPISTKMKISLKEGLIRTYPIDKTINYIKDYFKLSDNDIIPINALNGTEQIAIKVPIVGNNLNLIKKAFTLCGWYLAYPKESELKPNTIHELQFEKKYDMDISSELRKHESVIYHITPNYNLNKIKHIGLTPKSKNTQFDYPSRAYFVLGSAKKIVPYLTSELNNNNKSKGNNGGYSVITFDLSKIPLHVKFYFDPNSYGSVYTLDNVTPDAIIDIQEIIFKGYN